MVVDWRNASYPKIALVNKPILVIHRGKGWGVTVWRCCDNGARRGTREGDELRLWRMGGGVTEFRGIMLEGGWEGFDSLYITIPLILHLTTIVSPGLEVIPVPLVIMVPSWVDPSFDTIVWREGRGISWCGRTDSVASSLWDSAFWTRLFKSRRRAIIEIINWGWELPAWSCLTVSATKGC